MKRVKASSSPRPSSPSQTQKLTSERNQGFANGEDVSLQDMKKKQSTFASSKSPTKIDDRLQSRSNDEYKHNIAPWNGSNGSHNSLSCNADALADNDPLEPLPFNHQLPNHSHANLVTSSAPHNSIVHEIMSRNNSSCKDMNKYVSPPLVGPIHPDTFRQSDNCVDHPPFIHNQDLVYNRYTHAEHQTLTSPLRRQFPQNPPIYRQQQWTSPIFPPYTPSTDTNTSNVTYHRSTFQCQASTDHHHYYSKQHHLRQMAGNFFMTATNHLFHHFGFGISAPVEKAIPTPSLQQPRRPNIFVPTRGIGPVYDPNTNDVLSGRGGRINVHTGNVLFREIVAKRKADYLKSSTKKLDKAHIAAEIVNYIRYSLCPGGRFLKEDDNERGAWYDIGDARAIKKVGQALREDAPELRAGLGCFTGGDIGVASSHSNDDKSSSSESDSKKRKRSIKASTKAIALFLSDKSDFPGQKTVPCFSSKPLDYEKSVATPQRDMTQQAKAAEVIGTRSLKTNETEMQGYNVNVGTNKKSSAGSPEPLALHDVYVETEEGVATNRPRKENETTTRVPFLSAAAQSSANSTKHINSLSVTPDIGARTELHSDRSIHRCNSSGSKAIIVPAIPMRSPSTAFESSAIALPKLRQVVSGRGGKVMKSSQTPIPSTSKTPAQKSLMLLTSMTKPIQKNPLQRVRKERFRKSSGVIGDKGALSSTSATASVSIAAKELLQELDHIPRSLKESKIERSTSFMFSSNISLAQPVSPSVFVDEPQRDTFFGRKFHPSETMVDDVGDFESLLSGTSISNVSALTDPMSSLSSCNQRTSSVVENLDRTNCRESQGDQPFHHQWDDSHVRNKKAGDVASLFYKTENESRSSDQAASGSVFRNPPDKLVGAATVLSDATKANFFNSEDRDDNLTQSDCAYHSHFHSDVDTFGKLYRCSGSSMKLSGSSAPRTFGSFYGINAPQQCFFNGGGSVASIAMSTASADAHSFGASSSVSNSVMSDLSGTLQALDLASEGFDYSANYQMTSVGSLLRASPIAFALSSNSVDGEDLTIPTVFHYDEQPTSPESRLT